MKKAVSLTTLFALSMCFLWGVVFCQEADISGTWVGETEVPDVPEAVEVTLVLEKKNGEYEGKISSSLEMIDNAEVEDIEFENNELSLYLMIFDGEGYQRIDVILMVEGDTMKGFWEDEEGNSAPVELKIQR